MMLADEARLGTDSGGGNGGTAAGASRPPARRSPVMVDLRERVKHLPVVGPVLYRSYMRMFRGDGRVETIAAGPLAGFKYCWFTRTGNPAYLSGTYELGLQQALCRELKPGDVFFDVGANAGFFSLLAARLVGPRGKVVAFEPHPETARQIRRQVRLNRLTNVATIVAAVSDVVGKAKFTDDVASVMLRLGDLPGAEKSQRFIHVRTTTLDAECQRLGAYPTVAKIDVEGAEKLVLRGAEPVITRHRPVLLIELHTPDLSRECRAMLAAHGYTFATLDGEPIADDSYVRFVIARPPQKA